MNCGMRLFDCDDRLLPYLGQLTLLEQGEEAMWLVNKLLQFVLPAPGLA